MFCPHKTQKKELKGYKNNSWSKRIFGDCPNIYSSEGMELNVTESLISNSGWTLIEEAVVEDTPF